MGVPATKDESLIRTLMNQKKVLEHQGYKVAYITIFGSQNYNLDTYESDIDMKAVVIPNLHDLIENTKPVSTTMPTKWGECDVKDIRIYFQTLMKANPSYLESLFTDYYIADEDFSESFQHVRDLRDEIVHSLRAQMIRAMYGMMREKEKMMQHPYPSVKDKIEKFGIDGKQVHHIYRLWMMMRDYFAHNKQFSVQLEPGFEVDLLMKLKMNQFELKEGVEFVKLTMKAAKELHDGTLAEIDESKIDYISIKKQLHAISSSMIKRRIIEDVERGHYTK